MVRPFSKSQSLLVQFQMHFRHHLLYDRQLNYVVDFLNHNLFQCKPDNGKNFIQFVPQNNEILPEFFDGEINLLK